MTGKPLSDLRALLSGMSPKLSEEEYYFACVGEGSLMELAGYLDYIVAIFREGEGLTVVASAEIKDDVASLSEGAPVGPFAMITLSVNSDLMAVGFLAKITEALAKEAISVNAFSAYHHDHLFVPAGRADDAMRVLQSLSKGSA